MKREVVAALEILKTHATTESSLQYGFTEDTITQWAASRLLWFLHETLKLFKINDKAQKPAPWCK